MQQLSLTDTSFVVMETPRTPSHLSMVNIYDPSTAQDGPPTFAEISRSIEEHLSAAPSFRRKLVRVPLELDYPYWVEDDDFDLEFHMRHLALPRPGDWKQFRTQVARLTSRPLDLTRPPWEMTVIDGLDAIEGFPPGCFAMMLKIHHSAIDGVSGVELISAIHTIDPQEKVEVLRDSWKPEPTPSSFSLLSKAGVHSLTRPLEIARLIASNARPMIREVMDRTGTSDEGGEIPRTRLNQRVSAHRVWEEARRPLKDLKLVRRAVEGATINDVCLTVIAESMRRYLDSKGELPEESLLTMVPVSTRTAEQAGEGGNQISMMRPSLHTDVVDPIERLAAITKETREKKAAQEGVVMPVLLEAAQHLPGGLMGVAARAVLMAPGTPVMANTIVTNVPGSPVPLYFLGSKLVRSTGCVPLADGIGLFHCVSSYCDEFVFMFTACRDAMPDFEFYKECLDAALEDIVNSVGP
jgi:diacylglycerol O-acyltransferase / wax synthase